MFFQPFLGPYRIDLSNDLSLSFDTRLYLRRNASKGQGFDHDKSLDKLAFTPILLPVGSLHILKFLSQEFKSFRPDIVIAFEFDLITLFFVILKVLNHGSFKLVGMSDDSFDMILGRDFTLKHRIGRRLLTPFLDEIIVVEPDAEKWYQDQYKIGFFFPIIRDEQIVRMNYSQAISLQDSLIADYGLEHTFTFLYVGRLVKIKNIQSLIRAFSHLEQTKNILIVVGDGPEEERLKALALERSANVVFTGRLTGNQLDVWYTLADALVLPSIVEPFGAVTNEALMGGCYGIVSKTAGSKCLISDGVNGFVFDPFDENELTQKLEGVRHLSTEPVSSRKLRASKMILSYPEMIHRLFSRLDTL